MTAWQSLLDERDVRAVVLASARLVDEQDWQGFAELFAEDGQLTRPDGSLLQGRAAVYQAYTTRSPDRLTRHVLTNHEVTVLGHGHAISRCTVLLWSGSRLHLPGPKGRPADAAQQLGEFVDTLQRTPDGWRIQRREARFIFHREG